MWATWCKNCLTMDKTTLADADGEGGARGYVKIKFQAESPDESPAREVMQRFGAVGLPTYVVLTPKQYQRLRSVQELLNASHNCSLF